MKTLESVQELLKENQNFDFDTYSKGRIESYTNTCFKKNPTPGKGDLDHQTKVKSNIEELYKYLKEYIVIALDVNPHIANYNDAVKRESLEDAKVHAQLIIDTYKKHNWREYRRLTGILRTKRGWLKGDSVIRKDFFNKLTNASNIMDQAIKMVRRKKALTVKSVYPYWLW